MTTPVNRRKCLVMYVVDTKTRAVDDICAGWLSVTYATLWKFFSKAFRLLFISVRISIGCTHFSNDEIHISWVPMRRSRVFFSFRVPDPILPESKSLGILNWYVQQEGIFKVNYVSIALLILELTSTSILFCTDYFRQLVRLSNIDSVTVENL